MQQAPHTDLRACLLHQCLGGCRWELLPQWEVLQHLLLSQRLPACNSQHTTSHVALRVTKNLLGLMR